MADDRDRAAQAFDVALKSVADAKDAYNPIKLYGSIAVAAAKANDRDRAARAIRTSMTTADNYRDPIVWSLAYRWITESAAEAGLIAQ